MTTPTTVQVRFQFRADTAANWTTIDPVLLANELGRETDTGKIKIGDGTTAWSSLAYQGWSTLTYPLVNADIASDAAIDHSKLADITAGSVLLGNASDVPTATALSGDVTVNSSGVTAISAGAIVDADVSASAEIAVSKLANGTANQILTTDGTDVTWTDSPTIAGNVIISGNLTVNGTETIINVDTLQVEDKTIEMGNVTTPTDLTADGGGVVLKGASDKTLLWVDSTDSWTSSENIDLATGKTYKIAGTDVLSATALGSAVTDSSLTSVGNLTDLTVDTTTLVVDATNNRVGIGTASPATPLEIARLGTAWAGAAPISGTALFINSGSASTTSPTRVSILSGTESDAAIYFGDTDNSGEGIIRLDNTDDSLQFSVNGAEHLRLTSTGEFEFTGAGTAGTTQAVYFSGSAPVDSLVVDSNGRLGVGTSSPATSLHIASATPQFRLQDTDATNQFSQITQGAGTTYIYNQNGTSYGEIRFQQNNGTTLLTPLVIDSSQRVGIGTASPDARLDVATARAATVNAAIFGTTGTGVVDDVARLLIKNVNTLGGQNQGVGIGGVLAADASNDAHLTFYSNSGGLQERARLDKDGRLLVGTSSSRSGWFNTASWGNPKIQVEDTSALNSGISVTNNSNDDNGPQLLFGSSRSTAVGGVTVVSSGDGLGRISFQGADGSELVAGAYIEAAVDGTPGANDMPGRLVFSTTADGASSPTERMRITSSGVLNCPGVYNETSASAANVFVGVTGNVQRSTSSIKYKKDVEDMQDAYADSILQCRPVWYRSTCQADDPNWGWWGFIAEEVAEIDPRLVHWKTAESVVQEDGSKVYQPCDPEPEGVQYDRFVPHLLNLIKRQQQAIETLEAKVAALEGN